MHDYTFLGPTLPRGTSLHATLCVANRLLRPLLIPSSDHVLIGSPAWDHGAVCRRGAARAVRSHAGAWDREAKRRSNPKTRTPSRSPAHAPDRSIAPLHSPTSPF